MTLWTGTRALKWKPKSLKMASTFFMSVTISVGSFYFQFESRLVAIKIKPANKRWICNHWKVTPHSIHRMYAADVTSNYLCCVSYVTKDTSGSDVPGIKLDLYKEAGYYDKW